jgi:hypothetical protein
MRQQSRTVLLAVFAISQRGRSRQAGHDLSQQRLAVEQIDPRQVEAIEVQDVEDVVPDSIGAVGFQVGLEISEMRDALIIF